jgi:hypothetical protein
VINASGAIVALTLSANAVCPAFGFCVARHFQHPNDIGVDLVVLTTRMYNVALKKRHHRKRHPFALESRIKQAADGLPDQEAVCEGHVSIRQLYSSIVISATDHVYKLNIRTRITKGPMACRVGCRRSSRPSRSIEIPCSLFATMVVAVWRCLRFVSIH